MRKSRFAESLLKARSKGEEITLKEQALLKCLLGQFNNLFGVE